LSSAAIRAAIDLSRTRMGIEHIDMYWAHAEDRSVPLAETVAVFGELAAGGVVGRLGASNHRTWRVERARNLAAQLGVPGFSALQLRHTYLQPRPAVPVAYNGHQLATEDSLDYVSANSELALWVYSPLLTGAYVRSERLEERYLHVGNQRRLAALDIVAADLGVTRNQVVLAWLVGGDPQAWPIVGVSTEDQLDEALAGVRLELSAEHRAVLTNAA
jgi:aryl-alcohol dehydrogenase-like predicted oxidoreductase